MKPPLHLLFPLVLGLWATTVCSARTELDSLQALVNTTKGNEHIDALNALAGVVIANDLDKADSLLQLANGLAVKAGHKEGILANVLLRSRVLLNRYRYAEAEQMLREAQEIAAYVDDDGLRSRLHLTLGNLYSKRDRAADAFDQFLQGLSFANKANDADGQVTNLMNLGRLKEITGDLAKAEQYYRQAMGTADSSGLKRRLMELHVNMAVLEYRRDNLGLSIQHNRTAYDIATSEGDIQMSAIALSNLGFAEGLLGNKAKAAEYYDRSLLLRKNTDDRHGIGTIYLYKAKLLDKGDFTQAEQLALQTLAIADSISDRKLKLDAYTFLYSLAESKGDPKSALGYFKQKTEIQDSLEAKANKVRLLELEAEYQFNEMQRKAELQEMRAESTHVKMRLRNVVILGLSIIVMLLAVLFYVSRRQLRMSMGKEQKARNEATTLSHELASERQRLAKYTDKLLQRNLETDQKREKENSTGASDSNKVEALAQMIDRLNAGEVNDQDWITFNMLFEAAYPNFHEALSRHFGSLTDSEIRLASLIKLKLSNKEIGAILNISRDSVVRAKYRLRQKIGAESNMQLEKSVLRL